MYENTTRFLIPLLKLDRELIICRGFMRSYVAWEEEPHLKDRLFLLYRTKEDIRIPRQEIEKIVLTSKGALVIIPLAKGLSGEISKLIKGQYSKINPEIKDLILRFWSASKDSLLHGILHKDGKAKGLISIKTGLEKEEFWPKLNVEKETLRIGAI